MSIALMSLSLALVIGCKGARQGDNSNDTSKSPETASQDNQKVPNDLLSKVGDGSEQRDDPASSDPPRNPKGMVIQRMGVPSTVPMSTGGAPRYTPPKADLVVSGSYSTPNGAKIEVVGVAEVTKNSIRCWAPSGDRDTAMEERIKKAIATESAQHRQSFAVEYGKKNRIVIFKTTIPLPKPYSGTGRQITTDHISIGSVGDSVMGGMSSLLYRLNDDRPSKLNQPYENFEARGVTVAPNVSTTTAHLMVTVPFHQTTTLKLKPGAICSLGGITATVLSISPVDNRPSHSLRAVPLKQRMWQLEVNLSNMHGSRLMSLSYDQMVSTQFVNSKGQPISNEQMQKLQSGASQPRSSESMPDRVIFSQTDSGVSSMKSSGSVGTQKRIARYIFSIDPKYIKRLQVTCVDHWNIDIKDINLH